MRRFSSYGPVDAKRHFCVERRDLVEQCVAQLIGDEEEGHYFTIWAPRQTGKTWLMRQAIDKIRDRFGDRFIVGSLSMQGIGLSGNQPREAFLGKVSGLFQRGLKQKVKQPEDWDTWIELFSEEADVFDRPLLLFIDEFDSLPRETIDHLVALFRDMYLYPETTLLHGLALIGVRAVLGIESNRGSPFNVQRSLQVLNLTNAEVDEMFEQYQTESGQTVEPEVRTAVYQATRGQPGLVSWFGELLTEKYNPEPALRLSDPQNELKSQTTTQNRDSVEPSRNHTVHNAANRGGDNAGDRGMGGTPSRRLTPISMTTWRQVYAAALDVEPNNTVLNLIAKARSEAYHPYVSKLFSEPDLPFSFRKDWCSYLYLNGIIDYKTVERRTDSDYLGHTTHTCKFSSPFVQQCLFDAFTEDIVGEKLPVRALDPKDGLDDVYTARGLELPRLLNRYKTYLAQLETAGIDPWKDQPRRKDLRLTEAVGHFHLYAWLREALGRQCVISPEFPTGNGKVDLVIRWQGHMGVIEVKSFTELRDVPTARRQAAHYAIKLKLSQATLVLFVPISGDDDFLQALSTQETIDDVQVNTVAIAWR